MTNERNRLKYVDIFYALATIQIVFVHSRENPQFLKIIIEYMSTYHMSLFFFISGYLFSKSSKRNNNKTIASWFIPKLKKLVIPALVLTILALIPKIILEPLLHNNADLSMEYLCQVFFYPRKTVWNHFWFIPVYLTLMFLLFLYEKYISNSSCRLLIILLTLVLNLFPVQIGWLGINDMCTFAFYTIVGYTFERQIDTICSISKFQQIAAATLFFVVSVIVFCFFRNKFSFLLNSCLMIFVLLFISRIIERCDSVLNRIGKYIFAIYIYSWPFQAIVEIAFLYYIKVFPNVVVIIFKFIVGFIGPYCLLKVYNRFFKNNKIIKYILAA